VLYNLTKVIYLFLILIDKIIGLFASRFQFILALKEYIENKSYKEVKVLGNKVNFFIPNKAVDLRVKRIFSKEPGTLKWIDSFKNDEKTIFWDIGANIGLFTLYASQKHNNIKIFSFEPSTSNLRVLSRNISINKLQERISINQFPLTKNENSYLVLKETRFQEGCASNTFGEDFGHDGNKIHEKNSYKVFGNNINNLIDKKILDLPDYIKIDVDGIEHLILEGADKYLNSKKIKSISVEINEKFEKQKIMVNKILLSNKFKFVSKNNSLDGPNSKSSNTFNYIFEKLDI
jgi:FkbM family methyltransferase|tara:strand:- start:78 stop:947 length:870 start_codon:yes stop_codon:yes gene_type:complete